VGRVGESVFKIALRPATPVVRIGERRLAALGQRASERGRRTAEAAAIQVLGSPEAARVVDEALASPLPEEIAHSLQEQGVVDRVVDGAGAERLVRQLLESPTFERILVETLEGDRAREIGERIVESPAGQQAIEQAASSPAVRAALTQQTATFADEVVDRLRARAYAVDDAAGRRETSPVYGGIASRAVAFGIDLAAAFVLALVGWAGLALVAALVGEIRPTWLVGLLVGSAWVIAVGLYLTLFWHLTAQTPGMRLMRLRVEDPRGGPPGLGRSALRFVGLLLAIVPLFAGLLPVLFDSRRRALQDYIAGTVVVRGEDRS
jgi:uncharacterized RDD family membrane protein YckC